MGSFLEGNFSSQKMIFWPPYVAESEDMQTLKFPLLVNSTLILRRDGPTLLMRVLGKLGNFVMSLVNLASRLIVSTSARQIRHNPNIYS